MLHTSNNNKMWPRVTFSFHVLLFQTFDFPIFVYICLHSFSDLSTLAHLSTLAWWIVYTRVWVLYIRVNSSSDSPVFLE